MSCWVLNSGTLLGTGNVDIGVHFRTFSVCAVCLEIVGIPPFWHEKGLPDFSENPQGGVRGIRTLEPLKTTNTLAGCPYRPLRHDSTVFTVFTAQQHATIPSIRGQNTISRKKDGRTLERQGKSVLYACVCLIESQLSTRRFRKINCDVRTFVLIECGKQLSWNHEYRTENRSSQT